MEKFKDVSDLCIVVYNAEMHFSIIDIGVCFRIYRSS